MIYDYNELLNDNIKKKNKTTPEIKQKRQENIKKALEARKEKFNIKKT
jgi:hypothetical protein